MPDDRDMVIRANDYIECGQLEEALAILQALLKTDANNAPLWNRVGILRFRQGRYREALLAFDQATAIDPAFTHAWFNKSLVLLFLGKEHEALRALDKVLELNPRDAEARSQRNLIVGRMARTATETEKPTAQSPQSRLRIF